MRHAALLSLVIAACSGSGGTVVTTPSVATSTPVRTTAAPTPTPAPTPPGFGDGTLVVGTDVQPGTYRLRTPATFCYWARLSGFTGALGEILANQNVVNAVDVVTILPTDKGFTSRGCGRWSTDLSAVKAAAAPTQGGTFIVGVDIAPGTWRTEGATATNCYWARLSGFSGVLGELLANGNTAAAAVVTITPTDKGFRSQGCKEWTKIG